MKRLFLLSFLILFSLFCQSYCENISFMSWDRLRKVPNTSRIRTWRNLNRAFGNYRVSTCEKSYRGVFYPATCSSVSNGPRSGKFGWKFNTIRKFQEHASPISASQITTNGNTNRTYKNDRLQKKHRRGNYPVLAFGQIHFRLNPGFKRFAFLNFKIHGAYYRMFMHANQAVGRPKKLKKVVVINSSNQKRGHTFSVRMNRRVGYQYPNVYKFYFIGAWRFQTKFQAWITYKRGNKVYTYNLNLQQRQIPGLPTKIPKCRYVTLYEKCGFKGKTQRVGRSGCINFDPSGICVPKGKKVTIFAVCRYSGKNIQVTKTVSCFKTQKLRYKLIGKAKPNIGFLRKAQQATGKIQVKFTIEDL